MTDFLLKLSSLGGLIHPARPYTAGGGKGNTLLICTASGGEGRGIQPARPHCRAVNTDRYTPHVNTAIDGKKYTLHVHSAGGGMHTHPHCMRWKQIHPHVPTVAYINNFIYSIQYMYIKIFLTLL